MGDQPHGGADPCPALRLRRPAARRPHRRRPVARALERQHQPARAPGLGHRPRRPQAGRPARSFRVAARRLADVPDHRRGAEAPRGRSDDCRAARLRRRARAGEARRAVRPRPHCRDAGVLRDHGRPLRRRAAGAARRAEAGGEAARIAAQAGRAEVDDFAGDRRADRAAVGERGHGRGRGRADDARGRRGLPGLWLGAVRRHAVPHGMDGGDVGEPDDRRHGAGCRVHVNGRVGRPA